MAVPPPPPTVNTNEAHQARARAGGESGGPAAVREPRGPLEGTERGQTGAALSAAPIRLPPGPCRSLTRLAVMRGGPGPPHNRPHQPGAGQRNTRHVRPYAGLKTKHTFVVSAEFPFPGGAGTPPAPVRANTPRLSCLQTHTPLNPINVCLLGVVPRLRSRGRCAHVPVCLPPPHI